jgi:hypothetical protein
MFDPPKKWSVDRLRRLFNSDKRLGCGQENAGTPINCDQKWQAGADVAPALYMH